MESDGGLLVSHQWAYLAEGKMHIVLENQSSSGFIGKVLRIAKKSEANGGSWNQEAQDDSDFIERNLRCWFNGWSLNATSLKHVNEDFLNKVAVDIQPFRPLGRSSEITLCSTCFLENNLNWVVSSSKVADYSVELKVKCGLISDSPFIPPSRSIKLRHSRYRLMQLYKFAKHCKSSTLQPEWGAFHGVSGYCPRDLCSRSAGKISTALSSLLSNPQNNLKLSLKGEHVYGWNSSCTFDELQDRMKKVGNDLNTLCLLLSSILTVENTLERLEQLQKLDVIDIEGSDAVFKRLEQLTSSRQAAVDLLLKEMLQPLDLKLADFILAYNDHDHVDQRDDLAGVLTKLLHWRITESTSDEVKQSRRSDALSLVETLSVSSCVQLLKLWMVALMAKDASIIVSFERCSDPVAALPFLEFQEVPDCQGFVKPQSDSSPGVVVLVPVPATPLSAVDDNDGDVPIREPLSFRYSVTLVDVGLKAMDKLWTKDKEEEKICLLSSQYEHAL